MADLANLKIKRGPVSVAVNPMRPQGAPQAPVVPWSQGSVAPAANPVSAPPAVVAPRLSQSMAPVPVATQAYQEAGDPFTAFAQGWTNTTSAREQLEYEEAEKAREIAETAAQRKAAADLIREQFPGQEHLARGVEIGAWDPKAAMDAARGGGDSMPAGFRELQLRAEAAGLQPGTPEYQQFFAAGGSKSPLVQVNTGDAGGGKLRENLDAAEGKLWSEYLSAGAVSGANGADFQVLDELIGLAPQGPVTGRLAETFKGFSSAGDAFQSIVKRIAPTLRAPGSGATSDIEYDGMLRSLPALSNTPEANRMINEIMKSKAAINVERAQIIRDYQNEIIPLNEARTKMSELDARSIMTPEMQQSLVGIGGTATDVPTPQTQEEWDALPPGSTYIDPDDGKTYRKP